MAHTVVCTTCGNRFQPAEQGVARCPLCCTPVSPPLDPLEPPAGDLWHYRVVGEDVGPVSFLELQRLAREGRLGPEVPVRRAAGTRWLLAEQVSGLFDLPAERAEWYFSHGGQRVGPVSYPVLRKLILAGQLAEQDLLWQDGWPRAVSVGRCLADNLLLLPAGEIPPAARPAEIPISCPGCGDAYAVDHGLAGKRVLCRTCSQPLRVPAR
jgi:hypothetical protein